MPNWEIKTPLTMYKIPEAMAVWRRLIPSSGDWQINLKNISQLDSAGVAFLLWCVRQAKQRDLHLNICNTPKNLQSLTEVQGVWTVLQHYID